METVKEKLAILFNDYWGVTMTVEELVNVFVSNGVTIATDTNDKWVSVDERLPEKSEYLGFGFDGREFYKRLEIAYKTDTIEYDIGYYDGFKWFNERNRIVKNVVGWRILKNFPTPPKGVHHA